MGVLRRHRIVLVVLCAVPVGVAAAGVAGLWVFQESLMFNGRTAEIVQTPGELGWAFEELWLEVPGGRTHGWWMPLEGARGAVLFSHGSGKNVSHYLDDAEIFRNLGFSVLLYDYGGYGRSAGKASEQRCYADVRAVWGHLTGKLGVSPEKVVLAGASMGGGVTSELAAEVTAGAVVLENTFTSVPDVAGDTLPWLPRFVMTRLQFRNIEKVPRFRSPLLVVHSVDDDTVPFSHGRRLFEAAGQPKEFLQISGSHGGGKFSSGEVYSGGVGAFLERHLP
ncbi:MAG: alpha/beta fold hydrolase [Candidatus Hydrogenedens sp.]|nr:alpha/beta fold hydrolase [Candidatus Hydrogenedens sp.]